MSVLQRREGRRVSLSYSFRRIVNAVVENPRLFPLGAVLHAPEDTAIDDME